MNKLWWISAASFQLFDINDRHRLVQLMHPARYDSKKTIYSSSLPGDVIYFLKRGKVALYQSTPAKTRRKLITLEQGDLFGSINMIEVGFKNGLAQTESETQMLVLRKQNLEQLMKYFPETGVRMVEFFRSQQENLRQEFNLRNARNTYGRLVRLLLHYLDNTAYEINTHPVPFMVDTKELALRVGSQPDVIRSCLLNLERLGYIQVQDQNIKLLNRSGLKNLLS